MNQLCYSGGLSDPSPAHRNAFNSLLKAIRSEGYFVEERHSDATLFRFLRARKFNVANAKKMLIDAENWRKEFEVDKVVSDFEFTEKVQVQKYYPHYYHGTDKDGRPLYIARFGKVDLKALQSITTQDRILKNFVKEFEITLRYRFPACSAKAGYIIDSCCAILDLQNASLSSFYRVKDFIYTVATIGHLYYPECMRKIYFINAPYLFTTIWGCVKSWLDETTVAKVEILGKDYLEVLSKQISAENLPKELGGVCECAGGCCLSNKGPWNNGIQFANLAKPNTPKLYPIDNISKLVDCSMENGSPVAKSREGFCSQTSIAMAIAQ